MSRARENNWFKLQMPWRRRLLRKSAEEFSESAFYESGLYSEIQSKGVCSRYIALSHRALERRIGTIPATGRVLELGANIGEHIPYVEHDYGLYLLTDIRNTGLQHSDQRVHFAVADAMRLPFSDESFDRVLMGCLLHHLADVDSALREVRRVAAPGGLISLTLPTDPGILYRLGKFFGPHIAARRAGVTNPRLAHYQQHVGHYPGILARIENVFANDVVQRQHWPFKVSLWNANLFSIFQIRKT